MPKSITRVTTYLCVLSFNAHINYQSELHSNWRAVCKKKERKERRMSKSINKLWSQLV